MQFDKVSRQFVLYFLCIALKHCSVSCALSLLVPAYFYPSGNGSLYWDKLADAAMSVQMTAILNPNSGPGIAQDPSYAAKIEQVRENDGGNVIGYVHTSYTNRPLADVLQDIDAYLSFYSLDGFFIDEMANDNSNLTITYYQSIYQHIKNLSNDYSVNVNPGANVPENFVSIPLADTFVLFENSAQQYASYTPDTWQSNYPSDRFANIVYAVSNASEMRELVQKAVGSNVGAFFVTSDALPNPYDTLPDYWTEEVSEFGAQ